MRLHLVERAVGQGLALFRRAFLNCVEPPGEFLIRMAQTGFRIQAELARQIGQHEQHIPDLIRQPDWIGPRQFSPQFAHFLIQLRQHGLRIRPIEPNPGGARRQLMRPAERRQTQGNSRQRAMLRLGRPLGLFLRLPRVGLRGGRARGFIAKHMRMAADHLIGNRPRDVGEAKKPGLLRHPGVIDHLEQQIAEFIGQRQKIPPRDGIRNLIGFLDRVGGDGGKILHPIPRAADGRVPQGRHDVQQAAQFGFGGGPWDAHRACLAWRRKGFKTIDFPPRPTITPLPASRTNRKVWPACQVGQSGKKVRPAQEVEKICSQSSALAESNTVFQRTPS